MPVPKTASIISLCLAGAGALLWTGCSKASPTSASVEPAASTAPLSPEEQARKPAPEFALKDANGQMVKLADYKGKVVLLDFWATWCGPCKIEIPWFMDFEKQFKDRGFAVLGVSMDEDGWKVVNPYVKRMEMNYRVLLGNDQIAALYGGLDSLPTTYLIDRSGRIASQHVGLTGGKDDFKNEIEGLLNAPRAGVSAPAGGSALARLTSPK